MTIDLNVTKAEYMSTETERLRTELKIKDEALNKAMARASEYANNVGGLRTENAELKKQLQALPDAPAAPTVLQEEIAMTTPNKLGFIEAGRDLISEAAVPGMKIGGSSFAAKQIVTMAHKLTKKTLGKKHKHTVKLAFESKIGQRVMTLAVPGVVYLGAKMFPDRVPKAATVAAISRYAFMGVFANVTNEALVMGAPLFAKIGSMVEELPQEIVKELGEGVGHIPFDMGDLSKEKNSKVKARA